MKNVSFKHIADSINAEIIRKGSVSPVSSISIDSRSMQVGDLFWAIKGEKFDGNNFAVDAAGRGASGVIVSADISGEVPEKCWILKVNDTLVALQKWARKYREGFTMPYIGITGTVGKTTVKDMLAAVFSRKYSIVSTAGNLNGQIGVPLTLFNVSDATELCIVEMGISIPGEMDRLVQMVQPETAVLTHISPVHMEFFKTMEKVVAEKTGIFKDGYRLKNAVLSAAIPDVDRIIARLPVETVLYGDSEKADIRLQRFEDRGLNGSVCVVSTPRGNLETTLPLTGRHNALNSLAAIACGHLHGINDEDIIAGLAEMKPSAYRMAICEIEGITILNDAYNASPESMKAALSTLAQQPGKRRIAVLGDMLELGDFEKQAHRNLAHDILNFKVDVLITVGERMTLAADTVIQMGFPRENVICVADALSAAELVMFTKEKGDVILLKGSRLLKLEQIEKRMLEQV